MFKNNQLVSENNEITVDTIIGPSVSVEGDFKGDGNIIVEGEVRGNLKTKGFLRAAKSSVIFANISAQNAEISGQITGNIKIKENLDIKETAIIQGDIETKSLTVALGSIINGQLKMRSDKILSNENDNNAMDKNKVDDKKE